MCNGIVNNGGKGVTDRKNCGIIEDTWGLLTQQVHIYMKE